MKAASERQELQAMQAEADDDRKGMLAVRRKMQGTIERGCKQAARKKMQETTKGIQAVMKKMQGRQEEDSVS